MPGHLYAVPSNSGTFSRDHFAYVPEGEFRFGYRFNANFLIYAGYNILYISKVARPGDQIDTTIDQRQSPATTAFQQGFVGTRPTAIPILESTFWRRASMWALNLLSERAKRSSANYCSNRGLTPPARRKSQFEASRGAGAACSNRATILDLRQHVHCMVNGSTSIVNSVPVGGRSDGSTSRKSWCKVPALGDCNWK